MKEISMKLDQKAYDDPRSVGTSPAVPLRRRPIMAFSVGLVGAFILEGGILGLAIADHLPVPPQFVPSPALCLIALVAGAALLFCGTVMQR
jgi:hypothetical protein